MKLLTILGLGVAVVLISMMIRATDIQPQSASVEYPEPTGFVVDAAEILEPTVESRLEKKLTDFATETTNEVAVVTVKNLNGLSIEDYSIHLAELWKVGQKATDNGVIFLTSLEDRKVRIEVGQGLESILTDAKTGKLLDQYVIPSFKENKWAEGIESGASALVDIIKTGAN